MDSRPEWKKGQRARRSELDGVPPQVREQLARWIERKTREYPRLIAQCREYLRTHPDDEAERTQCQYWVNALSHAKKLCYDLRTERVRGVEVNKEAPTPPSE